MRYFPNVAAHKFEIDFCNNMLMETTVLSCRYIPHINSKNKLLK